MALAGRRGAPPPHAVRAGDRGRQRPGATQVRGRPARPLRASVARRLPEHSARGREADATPHLVLLPLRAPASASAASAAARARQPADLCAGAPRLSLSHAAFRRQVGAAGNSSGFSVVIHFQLFREQVRGRYDIIIQN